MGSLKTWKAEIPRKNHQEKGWWITNDQTALQEIGRGPCWCVNWEDYRKFDKCRDSRAATDWPSWLVLDLIGEAHRWTKEDPKRRTTQEIQKWFSWWSRHDRSRKLVAKDEIQKGWRSISKWWALAWAEWPKRFSLWRNWHQRSGLQRGPWPWKRVQ